MRYKIPDSRCQIPVGAQQRSRYIRDMGCKICNTANQTNKFEYKVKDLPAAGAWRAKPILLREIRNTGYGLNQKRVIF
jgi:hypothetical protein